MTSHPRPQARRPELSLWAIPLVLALFVLVFAAAHAVNVPYWDEWEFTEVISGTEPFTWD